MGPNPGNPAAVHLLRTLPSLTLLVASLLALGTGLGIQPALAQRSTQVQFQPGNDGTMLTGRVSGQEYLDYRLTARQGQKLFAELTVTSTNGQGIAYFNILPPGSQGEAIYMGHMDTDRSTLVTLPSDGTYTIRVYLMGNDKDAGKTVDFNLDVSIQ
jgi:hypothetical protein